MAKSSKDRRAEKKLFKITKYLFPIFSVLGLSVFYYVLSEKIIHEGYLPATLPTQWNLDTKLGLLSRFASHLGLYLLITVLLTISGRVLNKKLDPTIGAEPEIIAIFNRVIWNTLEQSLIFVPNYLYWLLSIATKNDIREAYLYAFCFILSRVVYIFGYLSGTVFGTSAFRTFGFSGTILTNGFLLSKTIPSLLSS